MADTLTSKGLTLLDPALNYDVGKFNANTQKINDMTGAVICTSTTRPSTGLFDGMTLWETDTRRTVVRASAAWVPIPQLITIADSTARAGIVTPYDGMMIYRQDRDWVEVYDGAAWRVQGVAIASSSANLLGTVTSPYNGQLGYTQDTDHFWQYDGSQWRYAVPKTLVGGKRRTTNAGATSGSTELQVMDTGALSLIANSMWVVEVVTNYSVSATGDDYDMRIRETTLGAQLSEIVVPRTDNVVPYGFASSAIHTTTAAETRGFTATVQRIAGTGNATVAAGSYLSVTYLGPTGVLGAV